jgi:hypothetical protein
MASWTAVRVRDWGRFWVWLLRERLERLGRGRMRREATKMTWRSENFFSSSRVRLDIVNIRHTSGCNRCLPLLGLVPAGQKGNRDEDDNSLASVANLDLRILVSADCCCPSAHRLFNRIELYRCRARSLRVGWFIPRGQRQTAEGAESSSGQAHCSQGQSTPKRC